VLSPPERILENPLADGKFENTEYPKTDR